MNPMKQFVKHCLGRCGLEMRRKGSFAPALVGSESFQPFVERVSLAGVDFSFWVGDSVGQQWYDPKNHQELAEHSETARLVRPGTRVLEIARTSRIHGHAAC